MKILIVNTSDINGGAARAAYRLHQSLLAENIESKMLVQNKIGDDYTVIGPTSKLEKLINKLRPTIDALPFRFLKNKAFTLFSNSWLPSGKLINTINEINPDIVHLHWINSGMIKIEDLAKINAPIVWSLHDMWPFSGGWHYEESLVSYAQRKLDLRILNRKKNTYSTIKNMTIIGVSQWLQNCALNSSVFIGKKIVTLPNPINTNRYKPIIKNVSCKLWGLPEDKKLVLFGAMGAMSDPRKGFKELTEALLILERDDIEFVVFGASKPIVTHDLGCKVHYVGTLSDDVSLVTLYSAVDVMIVPSLQEAFGQTASEAMSCGTPVVAFSHTGLLDIVDHKVNGYLAKPFDADDLATGIEWVLYNDSYDALCTNARDKVLLKFDSRVVAEKYINLYRGILND
ncbi:MAG: glycosyltransferase involved in cell wall biosynthesis [Cognaticolwellia sp.]|jgi:glycosyltransferase involved in cell wall biosynthesis